MHPILIFSSLACVLTTAYAGFSPSSSSNVAIYWGQNSRGLSSGALSQQRLAFYCANSQFNIIPLAFLLTIANPSLNLANAGDRCTAISGSKLFHCPELETDIPICQNTHGKTILISIGGATYTEGGFPSTSAAVSAANNLWAIFGPKEPGSTAPRPFGASVIDGFDFDFESRASNVVAFANRLRALMTASTASTGKTYLLTAAPQCPYPDEADGPMLAGAVSFDAVWVQFYNNYCGLQSFTPGSSTQNNFNFATWDNWAKTVSLNRNVKIFLGIPGSPTAAGSGYASGSKLKSIISYCKTFSSFGGVMIWDVSQVYANTGFLNDVSGGLGAPIPTTPITATHTTTTVTKTRATTPTTQTTEPVTKTQTTKPVTKTRTTTPATKTTTTPATKTITTPVTRTTTIPATKTTTTPVTKTRTEPVTTQTTEPVTKTRTTTPVSKTRTKKSITKTRTKKPITKTRTKKPITKTRTKKPTTKTRTRTPVTKTRTTTPVTTARTTASY